MPKTQHTPKRAQKKKYYSTAAGGMNGWKPFLEEMKPKKNQINVVDERGMTYLHHCTQRVFYDKALNKIKIEWLMKHGADVNMKNIDGKTPRDLLMQHFLKVKSHYDELFAILDGKEIETSVFTPETIHRVRNKLFSLAS